jgi:hypothetical protein
MKVKPFPLQIQILNRTVADPGEVISPSSFFKNNSTSTNPVF